LLANAPSDANTIEMTNQKIWLASMRSSCLDSQGDFDGAIASVAEAVRLAKSELDKDPQNSLMKRRYASTLVRQGDTLSGLDEISKALSNYEQAAKTIESLLEKDPTSVELAETLATQYSRISTLHVNLQQLPKARTSIDKALQICQDLSDRGRSGTSHDESFAIYTLAKAGILIDSGEPDGAKTVLNRHREFCLEKLEEDPQSFFYLTQMVEQHFRRSMLPLNHWFSLDLDPRVARENEFYIDFQADADKSLAYSKKIQELSGLNYGQTFFRDQLIKIRELVDPSLDEQLQLLN